MEESERRSKGGIEDSGASGRRRGGSARPGSAKRRELEKSGDDDDASMPLSYEYPASQAGLEIISKHTDQIHLEFVIKMAIACVVLVCLVVWFAWSFWRDSRRRRGGSRGRSVSRLDRGELERPDSLDSSVGTPRSIPSSATAAYQRDAVALGDQDSSIVTEFLNPLWVAGRREDGADTAVAAAGSAEARGDRPTQDWDGAGSGNLPRSDQSHLHKEHATELERRRRPLLPRIARSLAPD